MTTGRPAAGAQQAITVWEQELALARVPYQQALFHFPAPGRRRLPGRSGRQFLLGERSCSLGAWCEGLTGRAKSWMRRMPSAQRQRLECTTAGRMIVASFPGQGSDHRLRWGERAFMERLVDGDLAATNGGWQWSASSGNGPPKPLRPSQARYTQATRFDAEGHLHPSLARSWPAWPPPPIAQRAPSRPSDTASVYPAPIVGAPGQHRPISSSSTRLCARLFCRLNLVCRQAGSGAVWVAGSEAAEARGRRRGATTPPHAAAARSVQFREDRQAEVLRRSAAAVTGRLPAP